MLYAFGKKKIVFSAFLAPLAKASELLSWRCLCVRPFVHLSFRVCIRKLLLQKTSPQKLLTGFLQNFTGMFLR